MLDFYTTEKPIGYDTFVKKITGFDFKEEAQNNPKSTLITPQQAREAAGALLGNALNAQYHTKPPSYAKEKQTTTSNAPETSKETGIIESIPLPVIPLKNAENIYPKGRKRVKRIVDGDIVLKNSNILSSVAIYRAGSSHCSAAVIGSDKILTAAHCAAPPTEDQYNKVSSFRSGKAKVNGKWYQCKEQFITDEFFALNPSTASGVIRNSVQSETNNKKESRQNSADALLCITRETITDAKPIPIMTQEAAKTFKQVYQGEIKYKSYIPDALMIGIGSTGKNCVNDPPDYFQYAWLHYQGEAGSSTGKKQTYPKLEFKSFIDQNTGKDFRICGGDSGGPILAWNKQAKEYQLLAVALSQSLKNGFSLTGLDISAPNITTWFKKHHVLPQPNNTLHFSPSPEELPYMYVDEDNVPYEKEKKHLKHRIILTVRNNLTSESFSHHRKLKITQEVVHGGQNRTFSLNVKPDIPKGISFYARTENVSSLTARGYKVLCHWQWNMTALLLNDDPTSKKITEIYGSSQHYEAPDKTPGNWHYTPMNLTFIDGETGGHNITARTVPAHLLIQDKGDCTPCEPELSERSSSATLASPSLLLSTLIGLTAFFQRVR